jgi:hypothetical protein
MKWDNDFWYTQWPRVGLIVAIFMLILLIFNSQATIGSITWFYWLSIPLYMFHQYEEYVFPGGFQKQINIILSKGNSTQEKITSRDTFIINMLFIWVASPILILLGNFTIFFPIVLMTLFAANGVVHLVGSIKMRKYNPGLILSLVFNLPVGLYVIITIGVKNLALQWEFIGGIIVGIILHALLFVFLIAKTRRGK